jgi:hypothetical protein
MYKTLGCFHTLQPTSSPFETPSIPALLPTGFVEWQRLQLLLCPGEHVPFMQEAVRRYDIPTADGGIFPKYIPREAFPARPDEGMEKWHRMVTGSLEQAQYTRRLKNSPYASPRDAPHRGEGYFSANGKLLQVRRPSRSPRSNSHDLDPARLADERRRSSVPDIPSPFPPNQENTYRSGDAQQFPPPNSRTKQAQYNAPNRASNASSQHRTSDASSSRHRYSNSSHRTSNSSATYRPPLGSSVEASKQVPQSTPHTRHHRRPRSPSTINESSSGVIRMKLAMAAGAAHYFHPKSLDIISAGILMMRHTCPMANLLSHQGPLATRLICRIHCCRPGQDPDIRTATILGQSPRRSILSSFVIMSSILEVMTQSLQRLSLLFQSRTLAPALTPSCTRSIQLVTASLYGSMMRQT